MGVPHHLALSRRALRRGALLVRRPGRAGAGRRLDRLVADRAAAGLSDGRVLGFFRTRPEQRNWPAIKAALARTAFDLRKLDRLLEGRRFLLGEMLSLADITAGTHLYRFFELEIERPSLPQVERWYQTLQQRAAYREHVMLPFEELRGRLLDRYYL
ncbi:MAG TPA: glutathione S-transferase C-terminal domain-containing protein [Bradyrhizobium sp.]|nr:glutathione S-transferase C-terminal domain-containing protein [Bradyrhizobium sp.]